MLDTYRQRIYDELIEKIEPFTLDVDAEEICFSTEIDKEHYVDWLYDYYAIDRREINENNFYVVLTEILDEDKEGTPAREYILDDDVTEFYISRWQDEQRANDYNFWDDIREEEAIERWKGLIE